MKSSTWHSKRLLLVLVYLALLGGAYQIGSAFVALTRGPYLQMGTPNRMVVRWRTDQATNSRVRYGLDSGNLDGIADNAAVTTEHEVALANLLPNTKYYYSAGSTAATLVSGVDYFFMTAPTTGTRQKARIWIIGDAGTNNANQWAVRDSYYSFTGAAHTDLWVMLGDNAYDSGTDTEYQGAVFNTYTTMLRKSVLWPAFGNHDAGSASSSTQTGVFYNIFTLPNNAQSGGVASGTEAYYSFDHANVHFICLNSHDIPRASNGAMLNWLRNDLDATTQDWIIAFWHHPPYTKGSHNSDSESQLIEMRGNALPILEEAGVDMVFCGHSHSYERSFLLDGHYGSSSTLTGAHLLNNGSGREDGDGAYTKPVLGKASHQGAVYVVAGSSGKTSGGALNHPAMYLSLNVLGSVVLDVDNDRAEVKFLGTAGNVQDYFTMVKGGPPPIAAPSNLTATAVSESQINLAWTDNSGDESGFKIERKTGLSGTYAQIATPGAETTSYSNTGLTAGTTYYYRVRAYNGAGNSSYSNEANATTSGSSGSGNLALNKPATASSTNGSNSPGRSVDGSTSTYWRSGSLSSNTVAWLRVELQSAQNIGRVVVKWNGSYYAKRYQIQTSNDDANWTAVHSDNSGNGGVDNVSFTATGARYVRLYITRNNKSSERANEFEIYAPGSTIAPISSEPGTDEDSESLQVELEPASPNPFNLSTSISYFVPAAAQLTLKIYNLAGQEVATLVNRYHEPGNYKITFNASGLPNGLYFSILQTGAEKRMQRLVLMK